MKTLKTSMIIGAFFVLVTGTLAHFLYDWSGENPIVGLFTPVNESIWEHMKLLFFPMLLYSAVLVLRFKDKEPCMMCSLCFGNLLGTFLIPVLYYTYTAVLHRDFFFGYRNVSHQRCRRILRRISADAVLQASVVCDADLCAYGGFVFLLHAVYL